MSTQVTGAAETYVKIKHIRPPRQIRGRYATNTILSHRRPMQTDPMELPVPDPANTVRTEAGDGGAT